MARKLIKTEADGKTPGDDALFENLDFESPTVKPAEAALYVNGLSKTFKSGGTPVTAVKNVSFAVEPGEVIGLLGPNGAGKTTTIKSILGLVLPDKGEVRIQGIDPYNRPRQAYKHIDAMFEGARNDYWRLTVRENLRYFASIRGQNPNTVADRHEAILEQLDMADKADIQVRDLSRGMKQKVSLASILAANVSIAFLDEPTLGLDVETTLKLRRELVRLAKERGMTLLIASHDMDLIQAVCDRVIIMNEGQIVVNDTVEKLLDGFRTKDYRITVRNISEKTLSELRERFDITSVEQIDGQTRLEVTVNSAGFYQLADIMKRHGLELVAVETVQPNLAEVFVEITGEGKSARTLTTNGQGRET